MNAKQKQLLLDAWNWCDQHDKSTEFTLQYCSDVSGVDYDRVVAYICSEEADKDREAYNNADRQP